MKRRVARIGPSTLMVSLPNKWVKQHRIAKGQEIDVQERGNKLLISPTSSSSSSPLKAEIDLSGVTSSVAWYYLCAAYQAGAEEIAIRFTTPTIKNEEGKETSTLEVIQSIVDRCVGMEIIRQTTSMCIVKEISATKSEEFESSLRRVMLIISTTFDDLIESVKKGNKEMLESIYLYSDNRVNKFCYYCIRILSKSHQYHPSYYTMLTHLEEIGDVIKYLAFQALHAKKEIHPVHLEHLKKLYAGVTKLIQYPKKENVVECNQHKKALRKMVSGKETSPLIGECVNHLMGIANSILLMNSIKNEPGHQDVE
jgi:phosphate uptake regulator